MSGGITFTLITLISANLTILVSLLIFIMLIIHLQRQPTVSLLLITNTYAAMIVFGVAILSATINVLKRDLYGPIQLSDEELTSCRFQGFLMYGAIGCCNMSFVLQAIYRLLRVIYPKYKFLQTFIFNVICIALQWVVYILILLPSYFWPGPLYELYESDFYCGIPYEKLLGLLYIAANIFVLPVVYLNVIYARLMYFIRHQTPQLAQTQQGKRAQRDCMIIRRILVTLTAITLPGLPNIGFVVIMIFRPHLSGAFYMYRIQWMSPAISVFILSIALVFITPQLKEIIMNVRTRHNRIAPTIAQERQQPFVLQPMRIQI